MSLESPLPLYRGVIIARFQLTGNLVDKKNSFKIIIRGLKRKGAKTLKQNPGMPSELLYLALTLRRAVCTSLEFKIKIRKKWNTNIRLKMASLQLRDIEQKIDEKKELKASGKLLSSLICLLE